MTGLLDPEPEEDRELRERLEQAEEELEEAREELDQEREETEAPDATPGSNVPTT